MKLINILNNHNCPHVSQSLTKYQKNLQNSKTKSLYTASLPKRLTLTFPTLQAQLKKFF